MFYVVKKIKMYGIKMGAKVLYKGVAHRVVGFCLQTDADNPIILNGFEQDPKTLRIELDEDADYIIRDANSLQYSTYVCKDEINKI